MKKRGLAFTLIELLVVVAIIAILTAVALPNFLEAQTRAKVARARSDMRALTTAIESFAVDRGGYPSRQAVTHPETSVAVFGEGLMGLTSPVAYLTRLPEAGPFDPWADPVWAFGQGRVLRGYEYVGGDLWLRGTPLQQPLRQTYVDGGFFPLSIGFPGYYLRAVGPLGESSSAGLSGSAEARKFRNYDATNGTTSRGDIFVFQGNRQGFKEGPYAP